MKPQANPIMRTSVSHPLQIATIVPGVSGFGRVGVTFCPGKYDLHAMSGGWDRDLAVDLDAVRDWGAAAVITLVEPKELTLLRVERLGEECCGGICCGFTFQSLMCQFRTNGSKRSGMPPGRNCVRSCGTAPTFWSIAAEGSDGRER
jgi:hypothetical protein